MLNPDLIARLNFILFSKYILWLYEGCLMPTPTVRYGQQWGLVKSLVSCKIF